MAGNEVSSETMNCEIVTTTPPPDVSDLARRLGPVLSEDSIQSLIGRVIPACARFIIERIGENLSDQINLGFKMQNVADMRALLHVLATLMEALDATGQLCTSLLTFLRKDAQKDSSSSSSGSTVDLPLAEGGTVSFADFLLMRQMFRRTDAADAGLQYIKDLTELIAATLKIALPDPSLSTSGGTTDGGGVAGCGSTRDRTSGGDADLQARHPSWGDSTTGALPSPSVTIGDAEVDRKTTWTCPEEAGPWIGASCAVPRKVLSTSEIQTAELSPQSHGDQQMAAPRPSLYLERVDVTTTTDETAHAQHKTPPPTPQQAVFQRKIGMAPGFYTDPTSQPQPGWYQPLAPTSFLPHGPVFARPDIQQQQEEPQPQQQRLHQTHILPEMYAPWGGGSEHVHPNAFAHSLIYLGAPADPRAQQFQWSQTQPIPQRRQGDTYNEVQSLYAAASATRQAPPAPVVVPPPPTWITPRPAAFAKATFKRTCAAGDASSKEQLKKREGSPKEAGWQPLKGIQRTFRMC